MNELLLVVSQYASGLELGRRPRDREAKAVSHAVAAVGLCFLQNSLRHGPRSFEIRRVIERGKGLERGVCAHAPHGAELAAGRVKCVEARIASRPPPEIVKG